MARVPPQVIPRPAGWEPGEPAPWARVPGPQRTSIGLERVIASFGELGQLGPVPDTGSDRLFAPAVLVREGLVAGNQDAVPLRVNAGVLATLFEEDGETRVILTRRSSGLRTHKGEVSFPGGRLDAGEEPTQAALREAHEEVGLEPGQVTAVGWMHPVMTLVSSSLIMPVLATLPGRPHLVANPQEVERVFDVALAELAHPDVFHEERWRVPGRSVPGSADGSFPVWFFESAGEMIWGATARMLHELLSIVLTGTAGP